ncbi:MAG: sodium:alanine symporter family protein [Spirochaetaceae bacterium]|nr:MAG: sodium:alanine symporter family protein [Spirochaetaceae bacterium]
MEAIVAFNSWLNGIVWGPPFMVLLIGTGLYLTIRLGFFQFVKLGLSWRQSFGRFFRKTKEEEGGAISSFQAVSSAMAATIGVGNIAGVATAIALGGPGAVFWMWISALVGMATKFGEAALGVKYREIDAEGNVQGGVMYYIEKGLGSGWKWLAVVYAFLAGIAALGIGNMVQANTMAAALETGFGIPPLATGIGAIILVGLVILGGIKRIGATAAKLVPFMAIVYIIGALVVILTRVSAVPGAFGQIFYHAFNPTAATGGFAGAAVAASIRYGIARGIFSNEAGLGAASIVHAQAKNSPVRQGMWGIWEVFIDTIVVCTMTALVILVTDALPSGATGAALASNAFDTGLPGPGGVIVLFGLALFSYTTMLTWSFYGEKSWEYIFGKKVVLPYRLIFLAFLFVGAVGGLVLIWDVADTLNGLMAAPNLIALLVLAGVLVKEKNAYMNSPESKEK